MERGGEGREEERYDSSLGTIQTLQHVTDIIP